MLFSIPPNWLDMPFVFDQAVQCVNTMLEALRPPGHVELPVSLAPDDADSDVKRIGQIVASGYADGALTDLTSQSVMQKRGQTLFKLLGTAANRLEKLRLKTKPKK
jgi:hypothetical protein